MKIYDGMINHFSANVNKADATCQDELLGIEIRHDEESNANFDRGGYLQLWQNQKMPNLYPSMWKIMFELLITFHTSYIVQADYCVVDQIPAKRNALNFLFSL